MNKIINRVTLLSALTVTALAGNTALADEATCDVDRPVVFADFDWDSNAFHTRVARFILEKGYHCKTDSIPGSTIPLFNGMMKGNIDIAMEVWKDNVVEAWTKGVKANKFVEVGSNFPDATQAWYIPKYLVEDENAPAKGLKSATDLAKFKALFKDPEQPEKGRFYNCIAGWSCESSNAKKLAAYGLDKDFVNFRPGTGAALNSAIESSLKRKKPIVFYYWEPSWIMGKYGDQLVQLEEAPYDKAVWETFMKEEKPAKTTAYSITDVYIGATKKFADDAPTLMTFLEKYETDAATVSKALSYMQNNDATIEETAIHFLKNNPDKWTQWVPEQVAENVKQALK